MNKKIANVFEQCFLQILLDKNTQGQSFLNQAFKKFQDMSNSDRKGFWVKMQKLSQIKASKLHDFFHNTWSKRFCVNIKPYKPQILKIADETVGDTKEERIQYAIEQTKTTFPNTYFHQQTLYQLIAYRIKTAKLINSSNSIQSSQSEKSIQQNIVPDVLDDEFETLFNFDFLFE